MVPNIIGVLFHFRRFKYIVIIQNFRQNAIQKAHMQARINPPYRTFLRFLWPLGVSKDPKTKWKEYWNTPMDFRLVCSPWIHCQLIRYHMECEAAKDPNKAPLVNEIVNTFYIDDLITGSNFRVEAKNKTKQLFEISKAARYPLRKWTTNSELAEYTKSIVPFPDVCIHHAEKETKLLGIRWNQIDDTIGVLVHKAFDALRAPPRSEHC